MQYLGGKWALRREIATVVNSHGRPVIEPFCGGLSVTTCVTQRPLCAFDACEPLITLYRAMQEGWTPPGELSEQRYAELNAKRDPADPLTAFAGFGCSWGGKWFGGYARNACGRNYAAEARDLLVRKFKTLGGVRFGHADYREVDPPAGWTVYCDPPYADTVGYKAVGEFDHGAFWDRVREWSRHGTVLVSEFVAPGDFEAVAEWPVRKSLRAANGLRVPRVERLFRLR